MNRISEEQLNFIIGQSLLYTAGSRLTTRCPPPLPARNLYQGPINRFANRCERLGLEIFEGDCFFTTLQISLRRVTATAAVCKRWCNLTLRCAQAKPMFGLPSLAPWQRLRHIDYECAVTPGQDFYRCDIPPVRLGSLRMCAIKSPF